MRALRTEKNRAEHKTFSAVNWIKSEAKRS